MSGYTGVRESDAVFEAYDSRVEEHDAGVTERAISCSSRSSFGSRSVRLLLALASTVILRSESQGTQAHILLSDLTFGRVTLLRLNICCLLADSCSSSTPFTWFNNELPCATVYC
jgi:hypothetical protein